MKQSIAISMLVLAAVGVSSVAARTAAAQSCADALVLLGQGNSLMQVSQATGLTPAQIDGCRRVAHQPSLRSPAGPPPFGAAGPPPFGAAGPAPHGAAGPAPHGAAGPAPFGSQ